MEYHDITYDSVSNVILGGTQDNGTHLQNSPDSLDWRMINGGDGGDVIVDDVSRASAGESIRYYSSQNLGGFRSAVYDSNNNFVSSQGRALIETDGTTLIPQFDTPIAINAVDPLALILVPEMGCMSRSIRAIRSTMPGPEFP